MKYRMPEVMYGILESETRFPVFAVGQVQGESEQSEFLLLYSDAEHAATAAEEADEECEVIELAGVDAIVDYIEQPAGKIGADYRVMVDRIDDEAEEALVFPWQELVQGLRERSR